MLLCGFYSRMLMQHIPGTGLHILPYSSQSTQLPAVKMSPLIPLSDVVCRPFEGVNSTQTVSLLLLLLLLLSGGRPRLKVKAANSLVRPPAPAARSSLPPASEESKAAASILSHGEKVDPNASRWR